MNLFNNFVAMANGHGDRISTRKLKRLSLKIERAMVRLVYSKPVPWDRLLMKTHILHLAWVTEELEKRNGHSI